MNCKICNGNTFIHDKAQILNKYLVNYYYCQNCGFLQTEEPYWLNESYSKVIARSDTGIITRNFENATNLLLFLKFIPQGACLDFGGGHGILTRIMRDYGYDFYHYDKYAENLFASGFEGNLNNRYKVVTSFENFEHFVTPLEEIEKLVDISEILYFSTYLLIPPPPQ
jgi:2-polyprenyl-3-methyl-5-hydroxy-6-metoxy-1,4-benzoquinol methylase